MWQIEFKGIVIKGKDGEKQCNIYIPIANNDLAPVKMPRTFMSVVAAKAFHGKQLEKFKNSLN